MPERKYERNMEIRASRVMVIGSSGKPEGIMRKADAVRMAADEGLDLLLVSPNADPPVCRIADYGKFVYEASKKEKNSRKNRKTVEIKELRITPGIGENDLRTKAKKAIEFLNDGCRVKMTCRFRGREAALPQEGEAALRKFAEMTREAGRPEKGFLTEGRSLCMLLIPDQKAVQKEEKKEENG